MLSAVGFQLGELLVGGFGLARSTRVAQVSIDDRSGGKVGGWGQVVGQRSVCFCFLRLKSTNQTVRISRTKFACAG
jgi:hypothetical protein